MRFRSGFEATVSAAASHTLDAHSIDYEAESLRYTSEHLYTPDFRITRWDGTVVYVETKGYFDADDRSKMIRVKQAHPEKDIRLVFQRASTRLSKTSRTTYAAWAAKHGFLWAEGRIPPEWVRVPKPKASPMK